MRSELNKIRCPTREALARAHNVRSNCLIEVDPEEYLNEDEFGPTAKDYKDRLLDRRAKMVTTLADHRTRLVQEA